MGPTFKTIGLIGKLGDPSVGELLSSLHEFLTARGLSVVIDEATARHGAVPGLPTLSLEDLRLRCDLAIVVGGDGTMLNSARLLADNDVPVIGINLGRLGFLADIPQTDMYPALEGILDGHYVMEERLLLRCTITQDGHTTAEVDALNEVVVHKWNLARLIELSVYIDGQFVNAQRSDGLIVSTPTGSTAYALSAGGPLLHPSLDAIALVPVNPHTLSNRPIVVNSSSLIEIQVNEQNRENIRVTCDGQVSAPLSPGARIVITRKDRPARLIHPEGHNHYEILRAKLNWR